MIHIRCRRNCGDRGKKDLTLHCRGLRAQYCLQCDTLESRGPIPKSVQRRERHEACFNCQHKAALPKKGSCLELSSSQSRQPELLQTRACRAPCVMQKGINLVLRKSTR